MIGKVQDMVAAAVVVSAAENKTAKAAPEQKQSSGSLGENLSSQATQQPKATLDSITAVRNASDTNAEQEDQQDTQREMTPEFVCEMTRELNELMDKLRCDLQFQYHQEVGVMSVKMVDRNTQEVIKEYPPEDMVEGMIKAREWIGAFLDKNA